LLSSPRWTLIADFETPISELALSTRIRTPAVTKS
jgi:hypothetical protein